MSENTCPIHFKFMSEEAKVLYKNKPIEIATELSCGFDVRACFPQLELTITPGDRVKIPLGFALDLSTYNKQLGAFLYSRSSLGSKIGLTVAAGVNVIDTDYRGEIFVYLLNSSKEDITIKQGERIAQLVFQQVERPLFYIVEELSKTNRASGGFGSTGK